MALTAKKVYAILKRQISDMEAKLNSPVRYRGTVATADLLPLNPDIGDMYNIESKSVYGEAGMNVAWNGVVWDTMGAPIDMSLYLTKEEAESVIQRLVTEYFEKNPVKPGATTEQAAQIEQNKTDIASLKTETSSLKESISNKITKFYASNQGETHLADSDDGKIMDMMVYGKSEQKSTTGAQLINTFGFKAINGVPTIDEDGVVTLTNNTNNEISAIQFDLSALENSQYTFKNYSNVGYYVMLGSVDYSHFIQPDNSFTFTKADFLKILGANIQPGKSANFKCMLEKGSEATSYEPYTGGIPSPNPDYPQEIKSVVNPTIKVYGKNLLELPISNKSTQAGITFEVANDSVIKIKGINDGSRVSQYIAYNSQEVKYAKLIPYKNIAITISTYNDDVIAGLAYWLKSENYATVHYKQNKRKCTIDLGEDAKIVPWFFIPQNGTYTNDTVKFGVYYGTDELTYNAPKCQTVTLPYTLNAIPVSSGGNVTIDGQQYIADYVDVERGKLVRMCKRRKLFEMSIQDWGTGDNGARKDWYVDVEKYDDTAYIKRTIPCLVSNLCKKISQMPYPYFIYETIGNNGWGGYSRLVIYVSKEYDTLEKLKEYIGADTEVVYQLKTPEEIDLTEEEIKAFKALATYYPTTNISVNSEQLDGYTVFNYPISMKNGWDYVKKQLNDNRDYIYDMDARTQDTDLQAAEAYVNSEYAVALTELEV